MFISQVVSNIEQRPDNQSVHVANIIAPPAAFFGDRERYAPA
jgi:hypothetical protein